MVSGPRSVASALALSVALHGAAIAALHALGFGRASSPSAAVPLAPLIVDLTEPVVAAPARASLDGLVQAPLPEPVRRAWRDAMPPGIPETVDQPLGRAPNAEPPRLSTGGEGAGEGGAPAAPAPTPLPPIVAAGAPSPPALPPSPLPTEGTEPRAAPDAPPSARPPAVPDVGGGGPAGGSTTTPSGPFLVFLASGVGEGRSREGDTTRRVEGPSAHSAASPAEGPHGAAPASDGSRPGPVEVAAVTGGGGAPIPPEYDRYVRALRQRIQERLVYPWLAVRRRVHGVVELELDVGPDGRLTRVSVVGGAGAGMLREAAVKAVRDATPLPLPIGVGARPLTIRLPVVFELR